MPQKAADAPRFFKESWGAINGGGTLELRPNGTFEHVVLMAGDVADSDGCLLVHALRETGRWRASSSGVVFERTSTEGGEGQAPMISGEFAKAPDGKLTQKESYHEFVPVEFSTYDAARKSHLADGLGFYRVKVI